MEKKTKVDIYADYDISAKNVKGQIYIEAPLYGWIRPVLVNGNSKLGKGVWTFSTLPTNKLVSVNFGTKEDPDIRKMRGTCCCSCSGCYATSGCYNYNSTKYSLAIKTGLCKMFLDWTTRAIIAQIKADKIRVCRIHASGDFFSVNYIWAWRRICSECPETVFWTYTKFPDAENAFDDILNCNVVKSVIPGKGFNFGHCDYILALYEFLRSAGKRVYICRCGIDKNQHCTNCKACSENDYVLFLEHGTEYDAEKDPLFPVLKAVIESQK